MLSKVTKTLFLLIPVFTYLKLKLGQNARHETLENSHPKQLEVLKT